MALKTAGNPRQLTQMPHFCRNHQHAEQQPVVFLWQRKWVTVGSWGAQRLAMGNFYLKEEGWLQDSQPISDDNRHHWALRANGEVTMQPPTQMFMLHVQSEGEVPGVASLMQQLHWALMPPRKWHWWHAGWGIPTLRHQACSRVCNLGDFQLEAASS